MKLKDHVVSLELAKKLRDMGLKQEALFHWILYHGNWQLVTDSVLRKELQKTKRFFASAFTFSELIEKISLGTESKVRRIVLEKYLCRSDERYVLHENLSIECRGFHGENITDLAAEMFIHLSEKGILKP